MRKNQTTKNVDLNSKCSCAFKHGDLLDIFSMYCIQHCFICHSTNSTVLEDAGMVPRTVLTLALAVRLSNNSTRSHLVSSCEGEPKCENNEFS